jgi:hypothetical protein
MRRSVAVSALLGAFATALLLLPPAMPAAGQGDAQRPGADDALPPPAAEDAGALAAALEAGLAAGDAAALLALFAPDAHIKEGVAVLAVGPARVAAWVRDCLLPDVRLVPGTRRVGGAVATWELRDALGCYWRARLAPDGFAPAWDVAPAEGTLAVVVAGGAITTLTIVYDPAWEQRKREAQAAPIRTAQALATRTAAAPPPAPAAPSTQDRRTPSVGSWLAALGAALAGVGLLALLPRPHEAP